MSVFSQVTALVLAGGFGTRLQAVVSDRPKALAEVAGRPFLAWQLDWLASFGVRRAVICTGYRAELIEQCFGTKHGRLSLAYSREIEPLGTGGALRAAIDQVAGRTALVVNGDSLCDADLIDFANYHAFRDAAASLLLAHMDDVARYGSVACDAQGRVTLFEEKDGSSRAGWINAGFYLLERGVLESIPAGRQVSLERELFPTWIGHGLYGHASRCRFLDIGTPESYLLAGSFLAQTPAIATGLHVSAHAA